MIIQRFLLLFLLIASAMQSHAVNQECLVLIVRSAPVMILLSEHPVITYKDNMLHVETKEAKFSVSVSDIAEGHFSDASLDIRSVEMPESEVHNGDVFFKKLNPNSRVDVFTSSGIKHQSVFADSDGHVLINVSKFPKGTYIIKSATQTIKVLNK